MQLKHTSRYATAYGHLNKIAKGIVPGARIKQGQVIGYVGTTGRSTGPHLHYEILVDRKQVDPRTVEVADGDKLLGAELKAFNVARERIDQMRRTYRRPMLIAERTGDITGQSLP